MPDNLAGLPVTGDSMVCPIAMMAIWQDVWSWLASGLYPPPMVLCFVAFVVCAETGIFLNLLGFLPVGYKYSLDITD